MRTRHTRKWPSVFIVAASFVAALANTASAQTHPWTSVGSTGVVDEADLDIFEFVLGEARVPAVAPANSVLNLRYNVVSLDGFDGPGQYVWRVRFRDNGAGSRVLLDLRRHGNNGAIGSEEVFDSNDYPAAVGYQTRSECIFIDWDFMRNAYFIDATLTKSSTAGQPALAVIQLIPANCVP